jgi:hypothetical protein
MLLGCGVRGTGCSVSRAPCAAGFLKKASEFLAAAGQFPRNRFQSLLITSGATKWTATRSRAAENRRPTEERGHHGKSQETAL